MLNLYIVIRAGTFSRHAVDRHSLRGYCDLYGCGPGWAVVVATWLEQWPRNLEVPSSNPSDARAVFLFFYRWQSVLNQVPQERCIFAVFPIIITLDVQLEVKQA